MVRALPQPATAADRPKRTGVRRTAEDPLPRPADRSGAETEQREQRRAALTAAAHTASTDPRLRSADHPGAATAAAATVAGSSPTVTTAASTASAPKYLPPWPVNGPGEETVAAATAAGQAPTAASTTVSSTAAPHATTASNSGVHGHNYSSDRTGPGCGTHSSCLLGNRTPCSRRRRQPQHGHQQHQLVEEPRWRGQRQYDYM